MKITKSVKLQMLIKIINKVRWNFKLLIHQEGINTAQKLTMTGNANTTIQMDNNLINLLTRLRLKIANITKNQPITITIHIEMKRSPENLLWIQLCFMLLATVYSQLE